MNNRQLRKRVKTEIEKAFDILVNDGIVFKYSFKLRKINNQKLYNLHFNCTFSNDLDNQVGFKTIVYLNEEYKLNIKTYKMFGDCQTYKWLDKNDNLNLHIINDGYITKMLYNKNKKIDSFDEFITFFIETYENNTKFTMVAPWMWEINIKSQKALSIMNVLPESLKATTKSKNCNLFHVSEFIKNNNYIKQT